MTPDEIAASVAAIGFAKTHEIMANLAKQAERPEPEAELTQSEWQQLIAKNRRKPKPIEGDLYGGELED